MLSDLTSACLIDLSHLSLFGMHMTYLAVAFVDRQALTDLDLSTGVERLVDQAVEPFSAAEQKIQELEAQLQTESAATSDTPSPSGELAPIRAADRCSDCLGVRGRRLLRWALSCSQITEDISLRGVAES